MRCLLAFFDPLLGRAPLIIERHYRPAGQAQVCDDKADSRKQLPEVELHLRYYSPRHLPTGRLVEKALVPDHWLAQQNHSVKRSSFTVAGYRKFPRVWRNGCPVGSGWWCSQEVQTVCTLQERVCRLAYAPANSNVTSSM